MTTNPTKLRRRTQVTVTAIGAFVTAIVAVFLFNPEDQFTYTVTRLTLSLIAFPACMTILFQSIDRVRRISNSPEQRLRMVTIVLLLTEVSALLAISAVLTWNDPLPTNPAAAIIGMMIRGSLAYGTVILAVTRPEDDSNRVTISKDEYKRFLEWEKTNGSH